MLLFSTILDINDTLTKDGFIELVIKWNQGSYHKENVIPGIVWNGERNIKYGNDTCWLQVEEYRNQNTIAIRYEKIQNDGVVWDTDYVMNFSTMRMSVRLDRSYLEGALTVEPAFSTPAFLALLIDGGYVKDDNGIPVERRPVLITEDMLEFITGIIKGEIRCRLPIVYISKTFTGTDPVDTRLVAKRLKGVAHVYVEADSKQSQVLREMCGGKNEYNGAIGIYFPNPVVGHEKILKHFYSGSDVKMAEKVIRRVIQYSNSQKVDTLYTWAGVNNALLRDRYTSKREELAASLAAIKKARQEAETRIQSADAEAEIMRRQAEASKKEADEYSALVDAVDEEMESMRRQIEMLTNQIEAMAAENQGLRAKLDSMSSVPILFLGNEDELFEGEIKELILESLYNTLKNTKKKTRRADVYSDLIRSNGGFQGTATRKAEELKNSLRGYKNLSNPQKRLLEKLGFVITKEGGHYKLTYYGDGRYWTTLAVTPSDHRDGDNAAHAIIRDML